MSVVAMRSGDTRVIRLRQRQIDPVPRWWLARVLLCLAFALPALLATWAASTGTAAELATPNQQLLERVAEIPWDRGDAGWVGEIFPPLSTLLAVLMPGGRLGMSILGALVAGVFMQQLLQIMVQRGVPKSTTAFLMVAVGGNPLFVYVATENLPVIFGLTFFGLGLADVVRFINWGNTQAGFRAGMFFLLAVLSDLSGLLYVLSVAAAAPFLRLGRHGQAGARAANVLVVLYPTVAAMFSLILLNLLFVRDPLGDLGRSLLEGVGDRFAQLPERYTSISGWLFVAPVLCAWLVSLVVRRVGAILVSTLVFVAINLAFVLGLLPTGSAGNTYLLMALMAVSVVPRARSVPQVVALDVIAALMIAIAWATSLYRVPMVDWIQSLTLPWGG